MSPTEISSADSHAPNDDGVFFDAILTPHRSLPPAGFIALMAALIVISFLAGLVFFLVGAWPVVGFLGLDVLLVFVAFRVNYRRARLYETLHLTREALTVRRVDPAGRETSWRFTPAWLQVLPEDQDSRLTLRSHGKSLAIGAFLTAEERRGLAEALRSALAEARQVHQPS